MAAPVLPVASAQATGDAGGTYERHVGAACLATLLTGGMSLLVPDAELSTVFFQTRRLGWETDDLLLIGSTQAGQQRRVALQIKSTFYWRKSDEDCVQTIVCAWNDFRNTGLFDPQFDRIGIIVGQTNQKFSKGVRCLVDMARAARDAQDFNGRLILPRYVSSDAREALTTLKEILTEDQEAIVLDDLIWRFLCILDFAVLDFETPSSSAETLIKSLLAGTRTNALGTSIDTWNSLLNLAAEAAPLSREIHWADLPPELRERHSRASSAERGGLTHLEAYTDIIRAGAGSKIGGVASLPRADVVGSVLDALSENQSVIITGEAGSGKSVVARNAFDAIRAGCLSIAFRSETLAEPHIATSFVGIGGSLKDVLRLFSLHPRKVLWIESAERLLEKDANQRAAFGDLLRLFTQTPGWKLLITCRDYSVGTFQSTFLERAGVQSEVVAVPALNDAELDDVQQQIPKLALPLSQTVLRKLARNPFYLDFEARLNWSSSTPLPTNLRAFRQQAWRQIICREDEAADGLPLERERAMIEIAVRRARALTPFVHVDGLVATALQALRRDSLIISDPTDGGRFAPAHDVYEDWALLLWLNRLFEQEGALNRSFFVRVETHPAMRRAFRRWLTELLENESSEADSRMAEILNDASIEQHWKDDALVAVLQCSDSSAFLARSGERFLGNDVALLRRAVHLLQVACCKTPPGISHASRMAATLLVPSGPAWDTMPSVVAASLRRLTMADFQWLLRFLEACVSRIDKAPSCEAGIGTIARHLLACLESIRYTYRGSFEERILKIMLSIPREMEGDLRAMLETALSNDRRGRQHHTLPDLIWSRFWGETICREFPDMVMRVAEQRLALVPSPDEETRPRGRHAFSSHLEVDDIFGFAGSSSMDGYPASAWQGPFLNLLTYHPERGLDLILRLLNRACASYGNFEQDLIEEPIPVELTLDDGTVVEQWGNGRLWGAYRGQSVMPHVLESALMALEDWLLKKVERGDGNTVTVCSRLLRESNNVATTAVVASAAIAHPTFFGEAALPLLTDPILFDWDFDRSFQDQTNGAGALESMFPSTGDAMVLEFERGESRKKVHRPQNLEHLCIRLQLTDVRERVWALLDDYQSSLPPASRQDEYDRLWRIKLHRMDVRNFVGTRTDQGVLWQAGPFPGELEQMRQSIVPAHEDRERRLGLFMWGLSVFKNEKPTTYLASEWREKLAAVRSLTPEPEDQLAALRDSGAPHIAAVCLRDHWDDLSDDERLWCIDRVCSEIEKLPGLSQFARTGASLMDSTGPCCFVMPMIAAKNQAIASRARILRCLTIAITNPEETVAQWAALGIGRFLFSTNRPLTLSLFAAMVMHAQELGAFHLRQRGRPWNQRDNEDAFSATLLEQIVAAVEAENSLNETVLMAADYSRYPFIIVAMPLLGAFGEQPLDPLSHRFYGRIAELLAVSWAAESHHRSGQFEDEETDHFSYQKQYHLHQLIARFVLLTDESAALRIIAPLVTAAISCPKEGGSFIKCLIVAEDQNFQPDRFWKIWKLFADAFLQHNLGSQLEDHNENLDFIRALFLNIEWNADTQAWRSLTGYGHHLRDLFQGLPPSFWAVSTFAPVINRFSSELLLSSIPLLADKLQEASDNILFGRFALSQLESAIGDLVYAGTVEIRRNANLRDKTMLILDAMVEAGSSAAFKIRDDFLTPLESARQSP
jgi:hypothetical protein